MEATTTTTTTTPEPYMAYLGSASGNPGKCACAVIIRREGKSFASTKLLPDGDYDHAIVGAIEAALALVATKNAPVVIVSDRHMVYEASCDYSSPVTDPVTRARDAWRKTVAARTAKGISHAIKMLRVRRVAHGEHSEPLAEAHQLAYEAAFPSRL
jgi:hypothetical protein